MTSTGVMLLDFGLARALTRRGEHVPSDSTASFAVRHEGEVSGTAAYMAPERLEGNPGDTRTDMFALGAVLFEMATGKKAFAGDSRASIISAVMTTEPPAVSSVQHRFTPAFDQLVGTCLEKKPDARWNSAHDVELLLRQIERSPQLAPIEPSSIRRLAHWAPWAVALVGLVALCAALGSRSGEDSRSACPCASPRTAPRRCLRGLSGEDTLAVSPASASSSPSSPGRRKVASACGSAGSRTLIPMPSPGPRRRRRSSGPPQSIRGFLRRGNAQANRFAGWCGGHDFCRNDSSSGQVSPGRADILFGPTQDGIMRVSASGGRAHSAPRRDRAGPSTSAGRGFSPEMAEIPVLSAVRDPATLLRCRSR